LKGKYLSGTLKHSFRERAGEERERAKRRK